MRTGRTDAGRWRLAFHAIIWLSAGQRSWEGLIPAPRRLGIGVAPHPWLSPVLDAARHLRSHGPRGVGPTE
eukprot:3815050-Lingulodinium_polyedra.AAC.1